jgi:hypothetical protein
VRLRTDHHEVFEALRFLECDPEICGGGDGDIVFSIEATNLRYQILARGSLVDQYASPQAVAASLYERLTMLSLSDFPLAPLIHAASLRRGGRRVVLVGPKGGGKTTLALRLIDEGYEIEGDENVFVTGDHVVARPRALRVKASAIEVMPSLAETLHLVPHYENGGSERIYNLDPRKAGAAFWRIERGPVEFIVLIRPNHHGYSSLHPMTPLQLAREVIAESAFRVSDRGRAIADIAKVVGGARGFELCLGNLDQAISCLNDLFRRC